MGGVCRHVLPLKDPATPSSRNEHVPHRRWLAMIHRGHRTNVLGTWRRRLVLPKWWWLCQATPKGDGVADVVSLLHPSDSFSDPEQPVATPSTLADFEVDETTGPPQKEAMALQVCHILKTPLLPERLKLRASLMCILKWNP